jgi:GNAT superfamily N-acetyltransferase
LPARRATDDVAHVLSYCERDASYPVAVLRTASPAELQPLTDLLARANEAPYDIRVVAEEKLFGAGYSGKPEVRVFGDFSGVSVTCGKYLRLLAVDRAQRRRAIGTALLRDAEKRGASIVGAEPGNYFAPGIVESDAATLAFFRTRGYAETAQTQNLTVDLNVGAGSRPSQAKPAEAGRRSEVLQFIEREFGAIWRFEASHAETIFYVEVDGTIAGFSTHEANNRGLGFFGPTGVDARLRGRGLGRDLLLASLADLRESGFAKVIIPWTDSIDFYRKSCGAVIAHKFVIMRRIAA